MPLTCTKNIDWTLLRKQKLTLVWAAAHGRKYGGTIWLSPKMLGDLDGIIHLIDALEDEHLVEQLAE